MVLTDWELWAVAKELSHLHGEQAPLFIAERIGALAMAGDRQGVEVWKLIAARMQKLAGDSDSSALC